jgi:hypothetical protein
MSLGIAYECPSCKYVTSVFGSAAADETGDEDDDAPVRSA